MPFIVALLGREIERLQFSIKGLLSLLGHG
jgi:hypothetical protein